MGKGTLMKFKSIHSCDITNSIINKDWNFANNKDSVEFAIAMQKYHIKYKSSTYVTNEQRQVCIDNFDKLKNIDNLHLEYSLRNATLDKDMSVAYIDRGKPKTIVVISGGSWLLTLYRNAIEHQESWMLDEFTDYNVISIVEDISRAHRNPVLYDSCLYNGINDELNSIEKVANYIKQLIPNTEYNIIADCKNGHSSCMLAYYLNASRVLVQSGTSTCEYNNVLNNYNNNSKQSKFVLAEYNEYNIDDYFNISFEVVLRNIAFCNNVPTHLKSINSIAKEMPGTEFTYIHHANDVGFNYYIDLVDNSIANITKSAIDTTPHTHGDHYITLELRRSGFFAKYFKDII